MQYTCEQCGAPATSKGSTSSRVYLCTLCGEGFYTRPHIVCLCGSTRFFQDFADTNLEQTLLGNIVLSIGCDTKKDGDLNYSEEQKQALDRLHMHKVRMADEIIVLNRDGYIGESTTREIHMAKLFDKKITYKFGRP